MYKIPNTDLIAMDESEYIEHFGVKGMKWGVRKKKDKINSKDRILRKGTELQNVSEKALKLNPKRKLYTAYTSQDKANYIDLMGNFQYSEKGVVNVLVAKKNLKIASDQALVDEITRIARENPKKFSSDMRAAHKAAHFFTGHYTKGHYNRITRKVISGKQSSKEKVTKEFVTNMVTSSKNKTVKEMEDNFFGGLVKRGYDAISDAHDRDTFGGYIQDPLIILQPTKTVSMKSSTALTKEDLKRYFDLTNSKKFGKKNKDLSEIIR